MARRKTKPSESTRPPPKEQVVQIIVSSEDGASAPPGGQGIPTGTVGNAGSDGKTAISLSLIGPLGNQNTENRMDETSSSRSRGRSVKAVVPTVLTPNEVIVTEERGKTRTVVKSNYQTRRKSGVLKQAKSTEVIFDEILLENFNSQQQEVREEPLPKRRKGRPKKQQVVKTETLLDDGEPLLRVNGVDCSQAMDPDAIERPPPVHDDIRLSRKLQLLVSDANATSSTEAEREATLKAKVLLEQIANYKAKACKFSVETAIEYMKWFELSSKSYEFVRTMHGGGGLFTLPSAKTIRRYVDPFSESVQLTNLEAAQSTFLLQQLHHAQVELPPDQHEQPHHVIEHGPTDDIVQEGGVFYVEEAASADSEFLVRIDSATGEQQVVGRTGSVVRLMTQDTQPVVQQEETEQHHHYEQQQQSQQQTEEVIEV